MAEEQRINNFEKRIEESNKTLYNQSSKVSSLSRYIIYVIIATFWMLSYKEGQFIMPSPCFVVTMIGSFVYLLIDILHYFIETCLHHKLGRFIHSSSNQEYEYIEPLIIKKFLRINTFSFVCLVIKFGLCLIISIMFICNIVIM